MKRSALTEFNHRLAQLEQKYRDVSESNFKWHRDKDANLHLTYLDGMKIKLPIIPFRPYQIELQKKLFLENYKRILLQRPRRSGKEVESWNLAIQAAITDPGLYLMIYPTNVRAKAVLWEGSILMPDNTSVKFLDMIPKRLISRINNQEMKVTLVNGSILWILGSDIDPDKLRGTNPRGAVFAELAFQDPRVLYILLPVFRQNGGWLIGQSTYDGMNHFYQLIQNNKKDSLWYCREDSIETLVNENGQRYITDEMINEDRRGGMPEYLIQQEYYGIVQVNQETKYFSHAMNFIFENERIIPNLMIPNQNLYTAWDLGMNDCTAITLFQIEKREGKLWPYIVGYIENNNRPLNYYIDECRSFANKNNLYIHSHYIPHDGQKRDFNTGKNTVDFGTEMGEKFYIVPRPASKENAIESIRRKLNMAYFNKENTSRLIDCLTNYSKQYDQKLNTYKSKPLHDWSSHGVDSFQTMTLALDGNMIMDRPMNIIYYN